MSPRGAATLFGSRGPRHHRSPATAIEPAGQELGAPLAPGNCLFSTMSLRGSVMFDRRISVTAPMLQARAHRAGAKVAYDAANQTNTAGVVPSAFNIYSRTLESGAGTRRNNTDKPSL